MTSTLQATISTEQGGSREKFAKMLQKSSGGAHKGSDEYESFKQFINLTVFGSKEVKGDIQRNLLRLCNDEDYLRTEGELMIRRWIDIVRDLMDFEFPGLEGCKKKLEAIRDSGDYEKVVSSRFINTAVL